MFPTHATLVHVGRSYERREILGIRISPGSASHDNPPEHPRQTILITGGTHAREWISTSSVNFLIYNILSSYGQNQVYMNMVDAFDWVFIPSINPDGYEYTWKEDRLWRKNRQPTALSYCNGIDLDRSFGFKFAPGQHLDACSQSYAGQHAWEATEAVQLREWALNETASGTSFIAYLDLHSYAEQVLYPYSYSCDEAPPTEENLQELAFGLARAMNHASDKESHYTVHAACEANVAMTNTGPQQLPRLENGGGSPLDWFYEELKVKYTYQIKLRDAGTYGFLLPKEQIVPTGHEVLESIRFLADFLLDKIGRLAEGELAKLHPDPENPPKEQESAEAAKVAWRDSKLTKLEFRRRR
jgi:extracellular matrix protein 14